LDLALIAAAALAGSSFAALAGAPPARGATFAYVPVALLLLVAAERLRPSRGSGPVAVLTPVAEGTAFAAMLTVAGALLAGVANPGPAMAATWLVSVVL